MRAWAHGLVKGEAFAGRLPASWKRTPVVPHARHPTRSTGRCCRERQTRAVAEFLGALDEAEDPDAERHKLPKAISPVDPCSAWTAKANKRVQFGAGRYLIDIKHWSSSMWRPLRPCTYEQWPRPRP